MKKMTKRAMTLLEVMIVIFIISIIGSVIGFNMRGSIDQGKAFKTKEGISKVYNIIHLEITSQEMKKLYGKSSKQIQDRVKKALIDSELVHKPDQYLSDGWKNHLEFDVVNQNDSYDIRMKSEKYQSFCDKKGKPYDYPWDE